MPFWMKTRVGTRNHVLSGGADLPRAAIFGGCPAHSKALAIFGAAVATAFAAKGIIQSLITSSAKRIIRYDWQAQIAPRKSFDILALYKSDYYYYYSILKISVRRRCDR